MRRLPQHYTLVFMDAAKIFQVTSVVGSSRAMSSTHGFYSSYFPASCKGLTMAKSDRNPNGKIN